MFEKFTDRARKVVQHPGPDRRRRDHCHFHQAEAVVSKLCPTPSIDDALKAAKRYVPVARIISKGC